VHSGPARDLDERRRVAAEPAAGAVDEQAAARRAEASDLRAGQLDVVQEVIGVATDPVEVREDARS
jgi:hypothetical protein